MPIISQGSSVVETKKEKLYTALAQGNIPLLNTLLNDPIYQLIFSEMSFNSSAMTAIANSQTAMTAIANSQTAMTAIANSQTAMTAIANSQTAMTAIANSQTAMKEIINSQIALDAIQSVASARQIFDNSTALPRKSVPTMTSNTTPEGQAIGSSFSGSGSEYFRAFDKNINTAWVPVSELPQWIGYVFSVPMFIYQVMIVGSGPSGNLYNPTFIRIQCSSDGNTWQNVVNYGQQFTSTETFLNIPLRKGYYKYWRVVIEQVYSGSSAVLRELNFIGFAQQ